MTDALNKPIELGKIYGYSNNTNGFTHIVIGEAKNIKEKTVSLKVIKRKRALYSEDPKDVEFSKNSTISVKGNMLFPIREDF